MTAANEPALPPDSKTSEVVTETPQPGAGQTVSEAEAESKIPLQPLASPPEGPSPVERMIRDIFVLDRGLYALALILGFCLASIAVRNTDFWMHLASGRLLAAGRFHFGVDPFSYTLANTYWTNHNWLYDMGLYGFSMLVGGPESAVGGALIVIAKALLITLLATVMMAIRRRDQSLWAPAFCTALALLAMSPRLLLQPILLSLLFLALTLYILQKPRHLEADSRHAAKGRSPLAIYWWLPILFLVWANVDIWFFLGPVTVAIYFVGQCLQKLTAPIRTGEDAPEPGQLLRLLVALVVGTAACLVNPHHYHVFAMPTQLGFSETAQALKSDESLGHILDSVFHNPESSGSVNVVNLAYYHPLLLPLLLLGLVSFVLSALGGWRWWRFLLWISFAGMGLYQSRTIPFFAVVAGPIAALNLQDFALVRFGRTVHVTQEWKAWSLGGRIVTCLLLLGLLVAAYPGWLHFRTPGPKEGHRVAWVVDVDPSLRQLALETKKWHEEGLVHEQEHGFNVSPEIANYFAWFSADGEGRPTQKSFYDYRIDAFPERITRDFIGTRKALQGKDRADTDAPASSGKWQDTFRKQEINHVIVNLNESHGRSVANQLMVDRRDWRVGYQDGRSMVFGWLEPPANVPSSRLPAIDIQGLAFGPQPQKSPESGLSEAPVPPDFWTRYLNGRLPRPVAMDKTQLYLKDFMIIRESWALPFLAGVDLAGWTGLAFHTVFSPAVATQAAGMLSMRAIGGNSFALSLLTTRRPLGPPALIYLALRAARHAVAMDPNDAGSYLTLAQEYQVLNNYVEDRWRGATSGEVSPRVRLRRTQMITALEYALKLKPDDPNPHLTLFELYLQNRFIDLARDHLGEAMRLMREQDTSALNSSQLDAFQKQLDELEKKYSAIDNQVRHLEDEVEVSTQNQLLVARVGMAMQRGLGKRALDELSQADASLIGIQEARIYFDLLLATGRPEDVLVGMKEDFANQLGFTYNWYRALAQAALGNYQDAGEQLDRGLKMMAGSSDEKLMRLIQVETFSMVAPETFATLNNLVSSWRQAADYYVVRGLLALEEGDNSTAAQSFQKALSLAGGTLTFEGRSIAKNYLDLLEKAGTVP
jgi:tetratricopeptide (TPR) repeat protein